MISINQSSMNFESVLSIKNTDRSTIDSVRRQKYQMIRISGNESVNSNVMSRVCKVARATIKYHRIKNRYLG